MTTRIRFLQQIAGMVGLSAVGDAKLCPEGVGPVTSPFSDDLGSNPNPGKKKRRNWKQRPAPYSPWRDGFDRDKCAQETLDNLRYFNSNESASPQHDPRSIGLNKERFVARFARRGLNGYRPWLRRRMVRTRSKG